MLWYQPAHELEWGKLGDCEWGYYCDIEVKDDGDGGDGDQ